MYCWSNGPLDGRLFFWIVGCRTNGLSVQLDIVRNKKDWHPVTTGVVKSMRTEILKIIHPSPFCRNVGVNHHLHQWCNNGIVLN